MKRVFELFLVFVVLFFAASCGEEEAIPEVVKESVNKGVSSEEGGTITSSDGSTSIEIPADALDSDVSITMTIYSAKGYTGTEGKRVVSKVVEFEPSGLVFKKPIIITMKATGDIKDKTVTAAVYRESKGAWSFNEHGAYAVLTGRDAAGDPIMQTAAGDPIMLNAAGDPIMMSAAGDPIMMSAAGDPIMLASAGDPIMTNAAGDPIMTAAAGDPIMMTTGHFTAYTFIALGDDDEPQDTGDDGKDEDEEDDDEDEDDEDRDEDNDEDKDDNTKPDEDYIPACGNGVVDEGEACDDGNTEDGDYCSADCQTVTGSCGDGVLQGNEECDNGESGENYNGKTTCDYGKKECEVCTASCKKAEGTASFCGDGVTDSEHGEACDNAADNGKTDCAYGEKSCELCTTECQKIAGNTAFCGDGTKQADEACDNGDANGRTDCAYGETACELCTTECKKTAGITSFCGDGITDPAHGEACDNAADNGRTNCNYGEAACELCTAECQKTTGKTSFCGDGITDPAHGEACDDGNTADGDYCSADCLTVTGSCGDGKIQTNEVCDNASQEESEGVGIGAYCSENCTVIIGRCGDGKINRADCTGLENCIEAAGLDEECDFGDDETLEYFNGRTNCNYGETNCELCTAECRKTAGSTSYCGDGNIDAAHGEICDNGAENGRTDCAYGETSCELCTAGCQKTTGKTSFCGDGKIDADGGETCDDGTDLNGSYGHCNANCSGMSAYCGDGNIDAAHGETCDNGENNGRTNCAYGETSCELCTAECAKITGTTSYCGDGSIDTAHGEVCDNASDNGKTKCPYGETSCTLCTAECAKIAGTPSYCGDGGTDAENGETCDEGKTVNGTYGHCNATCNGRAPFCGDANTDGKYGEKCDDGTDLNGTYGHCNANCSGMYAYCGDGNIDTEYGETCDNASNNGKTNCAYGETGCQVCTAECQNTAGIVSYCGDGKTDEANYETCDNGADNGKTNCNYGEESCFVCTTGCKKAPGTTSFCGDGRIDTENGETCDDGANLNGSYGHCNANCSGAASRCGDGEINAENGETCDDGADNGTYGHCNSTCNGRAPFCGDGNINTANGEVCDNGENNGRTNCAYGETSCTICTTECKENQGVASYCGDGNIDSANGEACDNAEANGTTNCAYGETECTLCTTSCKNIAGATSYCGDGRIDTENGETCDDGANLNGSYGHCNANCNGASSRCGDGKIDAANGETCDDGELNGSYGHCNAACNGRAPFCGDGNIDTESGEVCDNGTNNGRTNCEYGQTECSVCTTQCQENQGVTSYCGDAVKDEANGETCDLGEANGTTNCSYGDTECTVCTTQCKQVSGATSYCGDGKIDAANGETCDDGTNLNGSYGRCNANCNGAAAHCGDGKIDAANGETCDDGELNGSYGHCNAACNGRASFCGDRNIDTANGETCDNGTDNGRTNCAYGETECTLCSAECQETAGNTSYCGDGSIDAANNEVCDRGLENGETNCIYGEETCTLCTTSCRQIQGATSYCGDGRIDEAHETCDDGANLNGTYGHCDSACGALAARCGDGNIDTENGETCDDGVANGTYGHCNTACNGRAPFCGDGNIDTENGEICDNGVENGRTNCAYGETGCTVCTPQCQENQGITSYCGDGTKDAANGEACDLGEANGATDCAYGDTECTLCTTSCKNIAGATSYCGDGRIDEAHETCDDGANLNGKYGRCNANCNGAAAHCGDGNIDAANGETCDDGADNGSYGKCNATCNGRAPFCGDGKIDAANGETCDLGADNGKTSCAYGVAECTVCTAECQENQGVASYCGDGNIDSANGEACDNAEANGASDCAYGQTSCTLCTTSCKNIAGATSYCGDGRIDEAHETCDDGANLNGKYGRCNANCNGAAAHCGDGNIDAENGETCDDGADNGSYGKCNTTCNGRAPFCGDGNIDTANGETCDNGTDNGVTNCEYGQTECSVCTTQCQENQGITSYCGDGSTDAANGEVCDNGENNGATDCAYGQTSCTLCTTSCKNIAGATSYCGDGRIDAENNETCDDGANLNGKYGRCNANCSGQASYCGDGNIDAENGETCDDGELNGTYNKCNTTCNGRASFCGDGKIDEANGETCDLGAENGKTNCAYGETQCTLCSADCHETAGIASYCGDGNIDPSNGEICDNAENNGKTNCEYSETSCTLCTTSCKNIAGATSYCGDGRIDAENNESCDDGANLNGSYGHCNANCSGPASYCGDGEVNAENGETCDDGELNGTYNKCNATCNGRAPFCGDGNIDTANGEVCDKGTDNGRTNCAYGETECSLCTTECQPTAGLTSYCGDSSIDPSNGETCDEGENNGRTNCAYGIESCTLCTTSCKQIQGATSYCGDGRIDAENNETCDDGANLNGSYGHCNASCNGAAAHCGDGNIDAENGETCDDGELNGTYGHCNATCNGRSPFCGDGNIDAENGEICDNGAANGATNCAYGETECTLCSAECQETAGNTSYCGDGSIDASNNEVCDRGLENGETNCIYGEETCTLCTTSCRQIQGATSYCGDGRIDEAHETCDDGANLNGTYGHCDANCGGAASFCGDGNIDTENGETCDDGANNGKYGYCNTTCNGLSAHCGDGNVDTANGEVCDNGAENGETNCAYGQTECTVCTSECREEAGITSYCGDGRTDESNNEACDNGAENGETNCVYGQTECTLCTTQCKETAGATSYCGDGRIDEGHEVCDNGENNGATKCAYGEESCTLCSAECHETQGATSYCGDGVKDETNGEICDNGDDNGKTNCVYGETSCTLCTTSCKTAAGATSYCGDGRVDSENNETCDDGANLNGSYGHCNAECNGPASHCGDGEVNAENGETCDDGELNGTYGKCNSTCSGPASRCGDGVIDTEHGEVCDKGTDNGVTNCAYGQTSCSLCTTECQPLEGATSYCGDGVTDESNGEDCDNETENGATNCVYGEESCQVCTTNCKQIPGIASYCGDGLIDETRETCDNGFANGATECVYGEESCLVCTEGCESVSGATSYCGDGVIDAANGEECDNEDENGATNCAYGVTSCTLCTTQCRNNTNGATSYCGDGVVDSENGETCDEGTNFNGSYGHCNAECNGPASYCGDGAVDTENGETCDDGELNGTYNKCNTTCSGPASHCGDGVIDSENGEVCDNGADNGETNCAYGVESCSLCTTECQPLEGITSYCGNGVTDESNGEECDKEDENGETNCAYNEESCLVCTTNCKQIPGATSYCGDGLIDETHEECDKGFANNMSECIYGEESCIYCTEDCHEDEGATSYCGDGEVDEVHGETCDNGDDNGRTDCVYGEEECTVCTAQCRPLPGITSYCGDRKVDAAEEACDEGRELNGSYGHCNEACDGLSAHCGDGNVDEDYETCDEGLELNGTDGHCNSTCSGYQCAEGYFWNGEECQRSLTVGNICTGITSCYDNEGEIECPAAGEDFYGQDVQYAALGTCTPQNLTLQTIEGDNVVIDNNTGLIWQQSPSEETYSYEEAFAHCENLEYAGVTGWRFPAVHELLTISDRSSGTGVNEYFTNLPEMSGDTPEFMLTKSRLAGEGDSIVFFMHGMIMAYSQSSINMIVQYGYSREIFTTGKVLCVYGDELPVASLTTSEREGDIVVTDSTTGLQWQKNYVGKNWQEALSYCENLEYAGYSDWRLPSKNELASLYDFDKEESPYSYFPGIDSSMFVSSTSYYDEDSIAMSFGIYGGNLGNMDNSKTSIESVICVRSDLPENTERTATCSALPENAQWNSAEPFTQTWSGGSWLPSNAGVYSENADYAENCTFRCLEDYVWYGGECVPTTRTVDCSSLPENAQWNGSGSITQNWSGTGYLPEVPETVYSESVGPSEDCSFRCLEDYVWYDGECVLASQTVYCTDLPANAQWNGSGSITQTFSNGEYLPSAAAYYSESMGDIVDCSFRCIDNYTWYEGECVLASQTVDCTGLPANAQWNGTGSVSQTWNAGVWEPSAEVFYSYSVRLPNDCSYKCKNTAIWTGTECESDLSVDNSVAGEPVVVDRVTGLRWQQTTPDDEMFWNDASAYCENLEYAGISDWRLPEPLELLRIIEGNHYYWSGKKFGSDMIVVSEKYLNHFDNYNDMNVVCVYGDESPAVSFIETEIEENYTVVDSNGLMWQIDYPENKTWEDAVSYCEDLEFAGFNDWRLPDVYEAATLFNFDKDEAPYTDFPYMPVALPDLSGSYFWTSSFAYSYINLNYPAITVGYDYTELAVLCVRTIQENDPQFDNAYCKEDLPANAEWNGHDGLIMQTWSSMSQWPSTTPVYNEEPSESECRFKCTDDYTWNGEACVISVGRICTGQTQCYGNANSPACPAEGEEYYGQDAQYVSIAGCKPRSYTTKTISGNKIVFDNNTGLQWQQTLSTETMDWSSAISYCENLTYAGYTDWHLATPNDMLTMRNDENIFVASPFTNGSANNNYWLNKENPDNTDNAISGNFYGIDGNSAKTNEYYTICVRGQEPLKGSFETDTVGNDEIVIDSSTGFVWKKTPVAELTWFQALAYCENLEYGGYDDWRLPNKNELVSLLDYDNEQTPFTDFPANVNGEFWTTSSIDSGSRVGDINLTNGTYNVPTKHEHKYTLCLRSDPVINSHRQAACLGLPEGAEWNTVKAIEQTWDGSQWVGVSRDGVYNEEPSTEECRYKCKENYTWSNASASCVADTQDNVQCTGLPTHAQWNFSGTVSQTWNGSEWLPSSAGYYSEGIGDTVDCGFMCDSGYSWDGEACTNPCDPNPCLGVENSTGECMKEGDAYMCACEYGFEWDEDECAPTTAYTECSDLPDNAEWNFSGYITQTWNGEDFEPEAIAFYSVNVGDTEDCSFKCADGYVWNDEECADPASLLPECSDTGDYPCTDPSTEITWSSLLDDDGDYGVEWEEAFAYCENLEEGGLTDWRLPTIDELKTVVWGCENVQPGGACAASDPNHLAEDDYTYETCNCDESMENAFGDDVSLWSSSVVSSDDFYIWYMDFSNKNIMYRMRNSGAGARCVHTNLPVNTQRHGTCYGLPEHAAWNDDDYIIQTWNGSEWLPAIPVAFYSENIGETQDCSFRCADNYVWNGSACLQNFCQGNPCLSDANSNGECQVIETGYLCGCNNGYFWNGEECATPLTLGNICTNLTKCYNNDGDEITCPAESEDYYGQDAQYAASGTCTPQSFTVHTILGDNIVFDNNTGLQWQQTFSENTFNWDNARTHCENLTYGGYSDWRLPTPVEIQTISDQSRSYPGFNTTYFTNITNSDSSRFWTSQERKADTTKAYFARYLDSMSSYTAKTTEYNVMCVRGDELPGADLTASEINGDVVVTDSTTGLMWQKEYDSGKTWQQALSYCKNLEYAGYDDWRLPNRHESEMLLNYNKTAAPYSDFPDMPGNYFWSSTTLSEYKSFARYVNFEDGYVSNYSKTHDDGYVRCVRTDPCAFNPCQGIANSDESCSSDQHGGYVCGCNDGYFWNGEECTMTTVQVECEYLPYNAYWNFTGTITQTWNGEYFEPESFAFYSEDVGDTPDCSFRCNENYFWCEYECCETICITDNPCTEIENSNGSCSGTPEGYSCGCNDGYEWNGSACTLIFPYTDPVTHLTWSSRSSGSMNWSDAVSHCENLTEGGYTDWHLPNIDELRKSVQNCWLTENGGGCPISDPNSLEYTNNWSGESCYCGVMMDGSYYSKLGDGTDIILWSSSIVSDETDNAWYIGFDFAIIDKDNKTSTHHVRCVR